MPETGATAKARIRRLYAYAVARGLPEDCYDAIIDALLDEVGF